MPCSYFTRFKECINSTFAIADSKQRCPREELKTKLIEMIGSYAEDALELVCGTTETLAEVKCKTIIDKLEHSSENNSTRLRPGRETKTGTKMMPKSLLPYFVSLFEDI